MTTEQSTLALRKIEGTELKVSSLCLGCNVFGRDGGADEAAAYAVLDAFFAAGGNFIDTADIYGKGNSERIIGNWMHHRDNRDKVVLATKVGMNGNGLGRAAIMDGIEDSLDRLQTDYIDLYYAHVDDEKTPLQDTLGALNDLVHAGTVRAIAASNYTAERLEEAHNTSAANGFAEFVAYQPHYNLVHRGEFEGAIAEVCTKRALSVFTYFSLANGYLTGKYRLGHPLPESARASRVQEFITPEGEELITAMEEIAHAHGVSVAAVGLIWIRSQPGVTAPIASARTVEQLNDLTACMEISLSDDELQRLTTMTEGRA